MSRALALIPLLSVIAAQAAEPPAPAVGDGFTVDVTTVDESRRVHAARSRLQHLATAPQAVTVIAEADLVGTPATTIPDRLRYEPGIDVYQHRHGSFDIGLRGYNGVNNNRVLALVDGRDFRWDTLGATIWAGYLHPSDVSRVEIAKGPSSVTYGANAFGGAILIADREPDARHRLHTVSEAGTDGRWDLDATALGPLGGVLYYKLSAGGTHLDDLDAPTGYRTHVANPRTADSGATDFASTRYAATLGARLPGDLRLEGEYHGVDIPEWEAIDDVDVGSNHTDWWFQDVGARLITPWGEIRHIHQWAETSYSNQKAFYTNTLAYPDFRYTQAGTSDVKDTTRAQVNLTPPNHALTMGAEYTRTSSRSNLWAQGGSYADRSSWEEVVTTNRALFAEDQYAVAPAWIATAGLRMDDHSRVGVNWSPRLAVNWVPNDDEFWLLSFSRGYRLPNLFESYLQEYYFASDPDLDAETVNALELGWQRRMWDDDVRLGGNAFASRANDEVWALPLSGAEMQANFNTWFNGGAPDTTKQPGPYFQFQNLDNPLTVLGTELSAEYRLPETPVTVWTNGTFQRARREDPVVYRSDGYLQPTQNGPVRQFRMNTELDPEINAPPRWKANIGVTIEHHHLFTCIATRYVGQRDVFSFANSSFPNGRLAVQQVPAYVAFDLSAGIDFDAPGTRQRFVRLSVLDLFDTSHAESYRAGQTELFNAREKQLSSDIGRAVVAQAVWVF